MGLCMSSRKITIDNENLNILNVSNDVINRLRQETAAETGAKKPGPLDDETQEAVDKALDYWRIRIEKLKSNQDIINNRLQEQYDKTYKEYEELLPKNGKKKNAGAAEMTKHKLALIKCYKANQKKSLNCSAEVENFNNWFENYKEKSKEEVAA